MKFVDFNKEEILYGSTLEEGYYVYTLGTPVEITTIKSNNCNDLLSTKLKESGVEDKLMLRYQPTNKLYLSKEFVERADCFARCSIIEDGKMRIECADDSSSSGILAFSGYLSANNLVEEDRYILCTPRLRSTALSRIRVLSIGARGGMLYGLFYVPSVKGLMLSVRGSDEEGISPINYRAGICRNGYRYSIKDWFDGVRVKEL